MKSFLAEMVAQNNAATGFSVSGKIRAGFKVMTRKASENPVAASIYKKALEGKLSFQQAATEIKQKAGIDNPFYPRNTPQFHAHPWDMESGKIASDKLMGLYGEERDGDTAPQLYRFPVVFPDIDRGGIDTILGSGLAVRGTTSIINYQSQYSEDGVRNCVYLPPVTRNADTSRKQFNRRQFVIRGVCDTEKCVEYAMGACRFTGTLRFYIPGMSGGGVFSLETGSTQAASEIYIRLASILQECGRLPNFTPDGEPVFFVTKAKKPRTYYDENGAQKKGDQWVVVLETAIDLAKMRLQQERKQLALGAPQRATNVPAAWMMQDDEVPELESAYQVDTSLVLLKNAPEVTEQAPQVQAQSLSDIDLLTSRANAAGILRKVQEWAELRHGTDWQLPEKVKLVCDSFLQMEERFGATTGQYLDLHIRLLHNGISYSDVASPYIKKKFGGVGVKGANLSQILSHIDELLEQGPNIALSVMESGD